MVNNTEAKKQVNIINVLENITNFDQLKDLATKALADNNTNNLSDIRTFIESILNSDVFFRDGTLVQLNELNTNNVSDELILFYVRLLSGNDAVENLQNLLSEITDKLSTPSFSEKFAGANKNEKQLLLLKTIDELEFKLNGAETEILEIKAEHAKLTARLEEIEKKSTQVTKEIGVLQKTLQTVKTKLSKVNPYAEGISESYDADNYEEIVTDEIADQEKNVFARLTRSKLFTKSITNGIKDAFNGNKDALSQYEDPAKWLKMLGDFKDSDSYRSILKKGTENQVRSFGLILVISRIIGKVEFNDELLTDLELNPQELESQAKLLLEYKRDKRSKILLKTNYKFKQPVSVWILQHSKLIADNFKDLLSQYPSKDDTNVQNPQPQQNNTAPNPSLDNNPDKSIDLDTSFFDKIKNYYIDNTSTEYAVFLQMYKDMDVEQLIIEFQKSEISKGVQDAIKSLLQKKLIASPTLVTMHKKILENIFS